MMVAAVRRFFSRYRPVFVLFVLSPLLAEFVFGATPLSRLEGLVLLAFLYGGGAVVIRELARRRGPGWGRIVLLGAAYAIVEEGLALQSLFNPDLFNAGRLGARALGVNWIWTEWTLGYHVVYSIAIPILLTELLFPSRKHERWLGWKGLTALGVLSALSALALGIATRSVIAPNFPTPPAHAIGALLIVAALVILALRWPETPRIAGWYSRPRWRPAPWLLGLLALLAAGAWFELVLGVPHVLRTGPLAIIPVTAAAALALLVVTALRRWSAYGEPGDWNDLHRLALVIGALPPMMLFGFFIVTASNRLDQATQGIASLVTLGLLIWFAGTVRGRERAVYPRQPVSTESGCTRSVS